MKKPLEAQPVPNHCDNVLYVSHAEDGMISALISAAESGKLFEFVLPIPREVKKDTGDAWYDWVTQNWSTKWDAYNVRIDMEKPPTVEIRFTTAWSPPIGVYDKMVELGYEVRALYYEPGVCFCGVYEDGEAETLQIKPPDFEGVSDELMEIFKIYDDFEEEDEDDHEITNAQADEEEGGTDVIDP